MLMLLFHVENALYALDSRHVVEVIPRVLMRKVSYAPEYVAGLFNYRGAIAPVIDLCHLIGGKPSRPHLSTRIIMVSYVSTDNARYSMGLMAERVTETLKWSDSDLMHGTSHLNEAHPYLGEMIMDELGMIQRIRLEHLLSSKEHQYLLASGSARQQ